jgi:hypothetical protein
MKITIPILFILFIISIILVIVYVLYYLKQQAPWENGTLAKIKLVGYNDKCIKGFIYEEESEGNINESAVNTSAIRDRLIAPVMTSTKQEGLSGPKLVTAPCDECIPFRKIGKRLHMHDVEHPHRNECLVYHKPNMMGWDQCEKDNNCLTRKGFYGDKVDYMDCIEFKFNEVKKSKYGRPGQYRIEIVGKDNVVGIKNILNEEKPINNLLDETRKIPKKKCLQYLGVTKAQNSTNFVKPENEVTWISKIENWGEIDCGDSNVTRYEYVLV